MPNRILHLTFILLVLLINMPAFAAPMSDVERSAIYVPTRDGTKLAIDIYRPAGVTRKLPVILTMTPYHRARKDSENDAIPDASAEYFARHGYIVAIGDVRGKGASFGSRQAPSDQQEQRDIYDVIEWLASQPFSDGNVGMRGCSYLGSTVTGGLRSQAPSLKAAVVGSTQFDMMTSFTRGGAPRVRKLADEMAGIDAHLAAAVPVDADPKGKLLAQTRQAKEKNLSTGDIWRSVPFRDSTSAITNDQYWITSSVYHDAQKINEAGVPIFMYGSWHDLFANETINMWHTLENTKMLLMGPGAHCESPNMDRDAQEIAFFDYYLKNKDNGFEQKPSVLYYVERGKYGHEWQSADAWPLPAEVKRYHLGSQDDKGMLFTGGALEFQAALSKIPPENILPHKDLSVVRANVDPVSVAFTSEPLSAPLLIAGTPVVNLVVSAPLDDYVVHAYLEQVNWVREPIVISRGKLLASRRKLGDAPYVTQNPFPTQLTDDALSVGKNQPVTLQFALSPIAYQFSAGDRLRLAVTLRSAAYDPLAPISVYTGAGQDSWIDIPFAVVTAETNSAE